MQTQVFSTTGEVVDQIELSEYVFGIRPNIPVMHQALLRQRANARLGTHDTKTRGEVRGGGRKPWRQKGTGRARQGSTRAPHWRGGGTVFGPHPRSYRQDMPRKMRRLALRSALSDKAASEAITIVRGLEEIEPRTKVMQQVLEALAVTSSVLIVLPARTASVERAAVNLSTVKTLLYSNLNLADLLKYQRLILTPAAIAEIERVWGDKEATA
ncbi:MAG: 50S ribosomal protein L4 [Chloroflexi bacterium]|nr:50S ribosomal protein L4 [Chloroflexota bacterium]